MMEVLVLNSIILEVEDSLSEWLAWAGLVRDQIQPLASRASSYTTENYPVYSRSVRRNCRLMYGLMFKARQVYLGLNHVSRKMPLENLDGYLDI